MNQALLELWSSATNKFVAENIKFVTKNNLQPKNYGRKLVTLGLSSKSIRDHFISWSQKITFRDEKNGRKI